VQQAIKSAPMAFIWREISQPHHAVADIDQARAGINDPPRGPHLSATLENITPFGSSIFFATTANIENGRRAFSDS